MTATSDLIESLISYSWDDWQVTRQEARRVIAAIRNDNVPDATIAALDKSGSLIKLFQRVGPPELARSLIASIAGRTTMQRYQARNALIRSLINNPLGTQTDNWIYFPTITFFDICADLADAAGRLGFAAAGATGVASQAIQGPFSGVGATGVNPTDLPSIAFGKLKLSGDTLLTIVIGLVIMVGLQLFVKFTKQGKAMRAVSEDKEAAVLMGVNVNSTIALTFAIGSGLAAVASLMYCAAYPQVSPMMGAMLGLKAFVAAVLGGIGSIPGAMIGGLAIGLIESLTKAYIGTVTGDLITSAFSDAIVFAILIIVLLVKPSGIMGKNEGEKV